MKPGYLKLLSLSMALAAPVLAGAQCTTPSNIGTAAGNHISGYTGDGGAGTAARMRSPWAVATDASGNVYIADYFNHAVRKVAAGTGIITTIAGTGSAGYSGDSLLATASMLNGPAGLYVDASGNVYIADKFNERIRMIQASTGKLCNIAGNGLHGAWTSPSFGNGGPAIYASLTYPTSVTFDCGGNMYIADNGSQTVRRVDGTTGIITRFAGTHAGGYNGDSIIAVAARLNHPLAVNADCSGNVYIADSWNNRIRKVDAMGYITTIAGNGAPTYAGDGGPATAASLWIPWGMATDGCGNMYIGDYNNNAVRKITTGGTISTVAGSHRRGYAGDGGPADTAKIYLPSGVTVDPSGNMYIADAGNYVIRYMGSMGYAPRAYNYGTTQELSMQMNAAAVAVSNMLAVPSTTTGQEVTWTLTGAPAHGTVTGLDATATSAGGMVTPAGVSFTPEAGFSGDDEFTVEMNDGVSKASTTINVHVAAPTSVGAVTMTSGTAGIVPNPNNGSFKCEFLSEKDADLELVVADVTGRVILKKTVHAEAGVNYAQVELTDVRETMVIVSLGNNEVRYPTQKVVIAR